MRNVLSSFFICFCVGIFPFEQAIGETFGIGVLLGEPTGISGNLMLSRRSSIDMAVAYDLSGDENFETHVDYLYRSPNSINLDGLLLGWFFGVGGKFRTHDGNGGSDDFRIGPRVPIGINHEFAEVPVEIFAEFALIMNIIPATDVDFDTGIGARIYF
ncbi:MAG: hypothetical protein KDD52_07835 [Bdellovibrionales bacterium]|nr:hypothetical protein [Bdellovibrionales bacterium]